MTTCIKEEMPKHSSIQGNANVLPIVLLFLCKEMNYMNTIIQLYSKP